jgi:hypothetical protein
MDMERDDKPQTTTREDWTQSSREIQTDINETLNNMTPDIEMANMLLRKAYKEEGAEDKVTEISNNIIEFLNDKWGYDGDYFLVSGAWYEPMVGMNVEGILSRHTKAETLAPATSNGFMVSILHDSEEDEEVPRVGMSFAVGAAAVNTPSIQGSFELLAFAEPNEISLQYLRPREAEVVSTKLGEVVECLIWTDSLLELHLNHPGSNFYKLSAKKQREFFASIIDSVEEILPAPESLDKLEIYDAITPIVHYKKKSGKGVVYIEGKDFEKPLEISGHVIGVTVIDTMETEASMRYTHSNELGASGMGLSLIIAPYTQSYSLEGYEDRDVIVPIRTCSALKLGLV